MRQWGISMWMSAVPPFSSLLCPLQHPLSFPASACGLPCGALCVMCYVTRLALLVSVPSRKCAHINTCVTPTTHPRVCRGLVPDRAEPCSPLCALELWEWAGTDSSVRLGRRHTVPQGAAPSCINSALRMLAHAMALHRLSRGDCMCLVHRRSIVLLSGPTQHPTCRLPLLTPHTFSPALYTGATGHQGSSWRRLYNWRCWPLP